MSMRTPSWETVTHADDGGGTPAPALLWRFDEPMRAISSAMLGGGITDATWIINAHVRLDYSRTDPDEHLREIARDLGLDQATGVGLLTAARVENVASAAHDGVRCDATVGLSVPTWAAAVDTPGRTDRRWHPTRGWVPGGDTGSHSDGAETGWRPGTINIVCFVPVPLTDAALVGAVLTATEAKTQALIEAGVPGSGTASDAIVVCCPTARSAGRSGNAASGVIPEPFAGPRSRVGSPLARTAHEAVGIGAARYIERHRTH